MVKFFSRQTTFILHKLLAVRGRWAAQDQHMHIEG